MARTARVKKTNNGTSHYHLMSRANDKRFLFEKGRVKTQLVDALRRSAEFSGIVKHASDYAWSWIAAPDEPFEGTVPEERLLRRG